MDGRSSNMSIEAYNMEALHKNISKAIEDSLLDMQIQIIDEAVEKFRNAVSDKVALAALKLSSSYDIIQMEDRLRIEVRFKNG